MTRRTNQGGEMRRSGAALIVCAMIAGMSGTFATRASAQEDRKPVVAWGGGNLIVGLPVGEFKDYIDGGIGANVNGFIPVTRNSPLSIRADIGFLVYGSETKRVCFSETVGCRIELDVTTTNNIFYGNIGPQLMLPTGAIRPYVNAGIGFGYFATTSSVDGSSDNQDFAHTNNFDDATMAYAAGGGLMIRLSSGKVPVMLDIGARYNSNGSVEYLKKGDIHDNADGSITFTPTRSEANLVTLNLGVSIGIRPSHQ